MKSISVEQLHAWRQDNVEHTLIDIREPYEREVSHIDGKHIPMADSQALAARAALALRPYPVVATKQIRRIPLLFAHETTRAHHDAQLEARVCVPYMIPKYIQAKTFE